MDINFQFNHSLLSIVELRSFVIRTTKQLEESFYDPYSNVIEVAVKGDSKPVYVSYGFSDSMLPIKLTFSLREDIVVTSGASVISREEGRKYYCGGAKKN